MVIGTKFGGMRNENKIKPLNAHCSVFTYDEYGNITRFQTYEPDGRLRNDFVFTYIPKQEPTRT